MRAAFSADAQRFAKHSARIDDMLLDWSKCRVDETALALLEDLATVCDVAGRRDAMFAGEKINTTEDRAVLHTALRNRSNTPVIVDGADVMPDVNAVLAAMADFCHAIRAGTLAGATGRTITDVVNIGIGGSDLGPAMAVLALAPYHDGPRCHFVSNVDGAHIADTLAGLDAETTLFIVASKTFTTIETMTNAGTARAWLVERLGEDAVGAAFRAVSTALDKVAAFGIAEERVFGFWDWVGGRYSLWSAHRPADHAGGRAGEFREVPRRRACDRQSFPLRADAGKPADDAGPDRLLEPGGCGYPSRAVIPYDQRLSRLPAYLQQLDMESNGKGVTIDGAPVEGVSGPVVWGEPGTNGQHAFFQLLHQGTDIMPVEFLIAANGHEPESAPPSRPAARQLPRAVGGADEGPHAGRGEGAADCQGHEPAEADRTRAASRLHRQPPVDHLLYDKLDPYTLGRLIALYEHRVFVEGAALRHQRFRPMGRRTGQGTGDSAASGGRTGDGADSRDSSTAAPGGSSQGARRPLIPRRGIAVPNTKCNKTELLPSLVVFPADD